ncbi:bifunctional 4-hydroxy-2-oxoglutarate aldolase/2-dehydro-3-deoxy-phosphogluconate aldolase [Roseivirga echinicomitans]|uniref:Keto-deoxy-phosphogluconate aldolase n=1 Tax=Roseivirga echinicomitans TaxID=296218 RepID=A0A150X227_9BACT|nr:bifunctional 4-hydroxy-2-oxoglutarate aldolase/2-dehydro-3-deoxy-phosphogluconate aldolase [Roseivirga echinicomitans]KYG72770.1 keto-deoxy-phosphogluconate aldolase [Roseivirga echinicomitans]
MANFTRIEVTTSMYKTGIVPVFYHPDLEVCKSVLKACYDGGVRVFEFTNRADMAHEVFAEINQYALAELPGMMLGIGSIIDAATTALYLQIGANFIVSPIVDAEMARICNKRKVAWSPGCGSVTEISLAHELGAEVVKVFPGGSVGGPSFVKGARGPLPWASIMPTGGVEPTEESLSAWFKAGVHCVGLGSQLFTKDVVEHGNYAALETSVKKSIQFVENFR